MLQSVWQCFLCQNLRIHILNVHLYIPSIDSYLEAQYLSLLLLSIHQYELKIIERKDCFKWDSNPHFQCEHLLCYYIKSITGYKKLKKLCRSLAICMINIDTYVAIYIIYRLKSNSLGLYPLLVIAMGSMQAIKAHTYIAT